MITISCVLKAGGIYDASWVSKLQGGVSRHFKFPHRFVCLTDSPDVSCETIRLKHGWPGWWSKLELFRLTDFPMLYLDLDTVIVGYIDVLAVKSPFSMLRSFNRPGMVGSGVMHWNESRRSVYEKFAQDPEHYIRLHEALQAGTYVGDQAFIWDALDRDGIGAIQDEIPGVVSYKRHCKDGLPEGAKIVCFHGRPRPTEVTDDWMAREWR